MHATNAARGQQIVAKPVVQSNWSQFSPDFQPDWSGDTKRIDYQPPNNSGGGSGGGGIINVNPPSNPPAIPTPIGLVNAWRSHELYVSASVLSVSAGSNDFYSFSGKGDSTEKEARYAQVINFQNQLLDQATAVAEMTSMIRDDSLSVVGRLAAGSYFPQGALAPGDGYASASMSTKVSAYYRVTSPLSFSLRGVLANGGGLDLGFSMTTDSSVAPLYTVSPPAGKSWAFDVSGTLTPGYYSFLLGGSVQTSGMTNSGGLGEYSFSFTTSAPLSADFNGDGRVDAADLTRWRGDVRANGSVVSGRDFLNWQRELGAGRAVATSSAAVVPEPSAGAIAALALCGCTYRRRRR